MSSAPGSAGRAPTATLTSVAPSVRPADDEDLAAALGLLRSSAGDLDRALAPRIGFAGAHHLILAARTRDRLARLDYDFDGLRRFMLDRDLTTVDLVWRQEPLVFWARNRSRSAAWSRTRPPARPPRRSGPTCAPRARSRRRRRSRSTRATTSAGPASCRSTWPPSARRCR